MNTSISDFSSGIGNAGCFSPDGAADFAAVDFWELEIKNHERWRRFPKRLDPGCAVGGKVETESVRFEHVLQRLIQGTIVLDYQHSFHR